jgi:hypothetical protein
MIIPLVNTSVKALGGDNFYPRLYPPFGFPRSFDDWLSVMINKLCFHYVVLCIGTSRYVSRYIRELTQLIRKVDILALVM